jgi:hypothetical protein
MRRVSGLYRSRALAEEAAARLAGAGLKAASISIAEQGGEEEAEAGMFDRLARLLVPEAGAQELGFLVGAAVPTEQIDAAAIALENGAERVEIEPPVRIAEQVVELSETAEELIVEKQPVVREEIVMRVQAREHVEHIHDTVRRTEVEVERFGPDAGQGRR